MPGLGALLWGAGGTRHPAPGRSCCRTGGPRRGRFLLVGPRRLGIGGGGGNDRIHLIDHEEGETIFLNLEFLFLFFIDKVKGLEFYGIWILRGFVNVSQLEPGFASLLKISPASNALRFPLSLKQYNSGSPWV